MHRHRRLPRWRLVMLAVIILAGLMMPAPAHAASLSPAHKAALNRYLKGLILQGVRPEIASLFVGAVGLCYRDTPQLGSDCDVQGAGLLQLPAGVDWINAGTITGRWRVYDAYLRRWGTMTVTADQFGAKYSGVLTSSTGGAARFDFSPSMNDVSYLNANAYDFEYRTSDDHGTGFVQWMPDGCMMQGIFQSSQNKDPNTGRFITSFVVFRRC